jgi:hypothetical protein
MHSTEDFSPAGGAPFVRAVSPPTTDEFGAPDSTLFSDPAKVKKSRAKRQRFFILERRLAFSKTWRRINAFDKLADARSLLADTSTLPFLTFYRIRRIDLKV